MTLRNVIKYLFQLHANSKFPLMFKIEQVLLRLELSWPLTEFTVLQLFLISQHKSKIDKWKSTIFNSHVWVRECGYVINKKSRFHWCILMVVFSKESCIDTIKNQSGARMETRHHGNCKKHLSLFYINEQLRKWFVSVTFLLAVNWINFF